MRRVEAPVVVECGEAAGAAAGSMTVVPLMTEGRVEGFEVRCQCGSSVVVECLYEAETPAPAPSAQPEDQEG